MTRGTSEGPRGGECQGETVDRSILPWRRKMSHTLIKEAAVLQASHGEHVKLKSI